MLEPLPPPRPRPVRDWLQSGVGIVLSGIALNVCSLVLVLYAASEEPFFIFSWVDVIAFFALAPALMVALFVWSIVSVATLAFTIKRWALLPALPIVLWETLNLLFLGLSVYGYWADMTHPSVGPWR